MTLQPTKEAELATTPQIRPIGNEPVVMRHAAFEVSAASFDEVTRILRARGYHHVIDPKNGAIYMDMIALTRGLPAKNPYCEAYLLENGKPGEAHRYLMIDKLTGVPQPTTDVDKAFRFAREDDAETFATFMSNFSAVCSPTTWAPVAHLWG